MALQEPEGYRIPIHHALTTPIMVGGAPRVFAILNGTIFAALTLGLHSLIACPIGIVSHLLAVYLAKRDPYFFQVIVRHLKKKSFYRV